MNGKAVIPLVAGLGIGGFALKIGLDTVRSAKAAPAATVNVWAAKDDIRRGDAISEEELTKMAFPASAVPKGAVREKDREKLIGRVPRVDAPAGLPVLESMLSEPGTPSGLAALIRNRAGVRAVAVKIDESSGVDFHLEPGAHVDVVGYFNQTRNGKPEVIARTLLENVEVAAVGGRMSAATAENEKPAAGQQNKVRAVTLLVRQEDVPKLHLAEQKGKIKLAMRGDTDSETRDQHAVVRDSEVIGSGGEEEPKAGEAKPSLLESLRATFARKNEPKTEPPAVVALPPVATPAQAAPALDPNAVVIWITNGAKRERVVFKDKNSRERIEEKTDATPAADAGGAQPGATPTTSGTPNTGAPNSGSAPSTGDGPAEEDKQDATPNTDPQES